MPPPLWSQWQRAKAEAAVGKASTAGLTLIKQHEEAESPGLHSLKIVALPVVLSQTGLSGLGSWGGGVLGGGSLGTAGHLMEWERPLTPRAGLGPGSPTTFCPHTPDLNA